MSFLQLVWRNPKKGLHGLFSSEEERRRISRSLRLRRLDCAGLRKVMRVVGVVMSFSSFTRVRKGSWTLSATFWKVR